MIRSYKDLEVYQLSYALAMEIFTVSRFFPKEEMYSLTSQIVLSSRSISANIAEGWAKRIHENVFKQHLLSAFGSCCETQNRLQFAKDCNYLEESECARLNMEYDKIGKMLTRLYQNWKSK